MDSTSSMKQGANKMAEQGKDAAKQMKEAVTEGAIQETATCEINCSPEKVFKFWHTLENLPKFMDHVKEVRKTGENKTLWRVSAPMGTEVSWEAMTTNVVENKSISWCSLPDSTIQNAGEVQFNGKNGKTEVKVHLSYKPPAGAVGHAIATILGKNPRQQMEHDLGQLKNSWRATKPYTK